MQSLIVISGKMGSGKSTVAELLKGLISADGFHPAVFKFADPLYELHAVLLPHLKRMGIRPYEMQKDGCLLQVLGTEYGRNKISPDIWVNVMKKRLDDWLSVSGRVAIIDDCRFENEFDAFPYACHIRLDAPRDIRQQRASYWRQDETHPSEIGLDSYVTRGLYRGPTRAMFSTQYARPEVTAKAIWDGAKNGFKS